MKHKTEEREKSLFVQMMRRSSSILLHSERTLERRMLGRGERNPRSLKRTRAPARFPRRLSRILAACPRTTAPLMNAPKPPSVSVSPSGEIMECSSVTLTCSSVANPAAKYTWYKRSGDKQVQRLSEETQFVLSSIRSSDSGEYYCTAENELGRSSANISITVTYAPKLPSVSVSPSGEIMEGSSVTLTCSSDANPAANYTWYKENQTLLQGLEGVYHLSSISSGDSGVYSCKSENQYGRINSKSLHLDVQYAPKPPSVSVSSSGEIMEGSSVTLTCSSDANPAANYTWYKEDEDSPNASGQNFTITDITAEHGGKYQCEAQNTHGRSKATLPLTVGAGSNGSWTSAVIGSAAAVFLAVTLLSVLLLISVYPTSLRKTVTFTMPVSTSRRERRIPSTPTSDQLNPANTRRRRRLRTLPSTLTDLHREPEVRTLERIQLHCTAQSTNLMLFRPTFGNHLSPDGNISTAAGWI